MKHNVSNIKYKISVHQELRIWPIVLVQLYFLLHTILSFLSLSFSMAIVHCNYQLYAMYTVVMLEGRSEACSRSTESRQTSAWREWHVLPPQLYIQLPHYPVTKRLDISLANSNKNRNVLFWKYTSSPRHRCSHITANPTKGKAIRLDISKVHKARCCISCKMKVVSRVLRSNKYGARMRP